MLPPSYIIVHLKLVGGGADADIRDFLPLDLHPVRQQILAMWLELLTIEAVDVEANFFELGGDSMLAIRLLRRLREELHPEINLGDVYEFPTVSQLSARVSQLIA